MTTIIACDLAVQFLHSDKIQGLEGMSSGSDEVQADVDPCVVVVTQRPLYF